MTLSSLQCDSHVAGQRLVHGDHVNRLRRETIFLVKNGTVDLPPAFSRLRTMGASFSGLRHDDTNGAGIDGRSGK